MAEEDFKTYALLQQVEARPYVPGEDMSGVTVQSYMTPEEGDMVARNPRNRDTLWLIPKVYFDSAYREFQPAASRASTKEHF